MSNKAGERASAHLRMFDFVSLLREAYRLGWYTERYSGGGRWMRRWRGVRWLWSEARYRIGGGDA